MRFPGECASVLDLILRRGALIYAFESNLHSPLSLLFVLEPLNPPRWHRFKSYQTRITSESAANHDSALMKFPSGPIKQREKFFFFLFLLPTSSRRAVRNRIMHNSLILFIYCLSRFGYRSPCGELFSIIQRAISAAKKVYLDSISLASYRHHVKASRT
jgi:hypothetical protein